MIDNTYSLANLIDDLTRVVEKTEVDGERVEQAEHYLNRLIRSGWTLPVEKVQPDRENAYARHALYRDPKDRFEVLALIWEPGQKTPLHDHDGTWGVEGVVTGRMKVTNYLQLESYDDDTVKLCYSGTVNLNALSTGELLPPADCHILEPQGDETTVTIHVYGKQLKNFKVFEPTSEKNIYRASNYPVGYTTDSLIKI